LRLIHAYPNPLTDVHLIVFAAAAAGRRSAVLERVGNLVSSIPGVHWGHSSTHFR
jgi:hypothetical protein